MRSTIIFSSKGNTVKTKFDIRFQYLVYFITHPCNINDKRVFKVTLLIISDQYGILLNVKEILFALKMIELKDPW